MGYFEASRGLIQGDPISHFLFIIMAEALGRNIQHAQQVGKIKGISITRDIAMATHQQFADDTMLMAKGNPQEASNFKLILDK